MLVDLPRGVNFKVWSYLGCSVQNAKLAVKVSVRVTHKEI